MEIRHGAKRADLKTPVLLVMFCHKFTIISICKPKAILKGHAGLFNKYQDWKNQNKHKL